MSFKCSEPLIFVSNQMMTYLPSLIVVNNYNYINAIMTFQYNGRIYLIKVSKQLIKKQWDRSMIIFLFQMQKSSTIPSFVCNPNVLNM